MPVSKQSNSDKSRPVEQLPTLRVWEYRGYPCLIMSNREGFLCGYTLVPPGNPLYGMDDYDFHWQNTVHGSITLSHEVDTFRLGSIPIAEISGLGKRWMIGFDCAHVSDGDRPYLIGHAERDYNSYYNEEGQVWDMDMVAQETENMIDLIIQYENGDIV